MKPTARMKLIARNKDVSCLKVLLAAEFAKVPVDFQADNRAEKPLLIVNEDVQYFSLNTAAWYVSSLKGSRKFSAEISSWLEWEATVLLPELVSKSGTASLAYVENNLTKAYLTGVSVFDQRFVSLFSNYNKISSHRITYPRLTYVFSHL